MRSKSSHRSCSIKGAVLKDLAIFTGNQKRLQQRCLFYCEYCEIIKNTYFEEYLPLAASGDLKAVKDPAKWIIAAAPECAKSFWVGCHRGFCGSSFIVPSYLRGYFVVPIFCFQFLDSKIFNFWLHQKNCQIAEIHKFISNLAFYYKSISTMSVLFILERCFIYKISSQISFVLVVFWVIPYLQYKDLFTCNSNTKLLQIYLPYFFINYADFLIANSQHSFPGKNSSCFFNFISIQRPKIRPFRGSIHSPNMIRVTHEIKTRTKFRTYEIPTRKNFRPPKYPREKNFLRMKVQW